MPTLELENCILRYPRTGYRDILDGYRIEEFNGWFLEPTFLGQLPSPTFGALKDFFEGDDSQTMKEGRYTHLHSNLSDFIERRAEDFKDPEYLAREILLVENPAQHTADFSLFEDEDSTQEKPVVYYDGRYSYTTDEGQYKVFTLAPSATETGSGVEAWNYKPDYKFLSCKKEKSKLFFGLELEVNSMIPWTDLQRLMVDEHPKQEPFLYAMSDSSIQGAHPFCYEIVSHPMTPRRMRKEYRTLFSKLEKRLKLKGKSISDVMDITTSSTGIHVHVSKASFSPPHARRFSAVWNMDTPSVSRLINNLAGRNLTDHRYASPSPDYVGRRLGYCLSPKLVQSAERYHSSTDTGSTIEVRVFRGIPTLSHVLRCIDSVEAMWYFTRDASLSSFKNGFDKKFTKWVSSQSKFRTLKETL